MYADYQFYNTVYLGFIIPQAEYGYYAERASDKLAPYAANLGAESEEKTLAVKKAQCRIADILYGDFKSSKNGTAKVNSESVSGYYTVAFTAASNTEISALIDDAIRTYLGRWLIRPVKVIY